MVLRLHTFRCRPAEVERFLVRRRNLYHIYLLNCLSGNRLISRECNVPKDGQMKNECTKIRKSRIFCKIWEKLTMIFGTSYCKSSQSTQILYITIYKFQNPAQLKVTVVRNLILDVLAFVSLNDSWQILKNQICSLAIMPKIFKKSFNKNYNTLTYRKKSELTFLSNKK